MFAETETSGTSGDELGGLLFEGSSFTLTFSVFSSGVSSTIGSLFNVFSVREVSCAVSGTDSCEKNRCNQAAQF